MRKLCIGLIERSLMEEFIPFCFIELFYYLPPVSEQSDGSNGCIRSVVVT